LFIWNDLQWGEEDIFLQFNASQTLCILVDESDIGLIRSLNCDQWIPKLNILVEMSGLGPLFYFLQIAVSQDKHPHHLSHESNAEGIFPCFQFSSSHDRSNELYGTTIHGLATDYAKYRTSVTSRDA